MNKSKDSYTALTDIILDSIGRVAQAKADKAGYDKSYRVDILGVNRKFTDTVSAEDRTKIINKYAIPATAKGDNYYTFKVNGVYYVKCSPYSFKLYEKVTVRIPNGSWDNMYIEYKANDTEQSKIYYSTTETLTNKVWIDGKPIYRLVYIGIAPEMQFWHNMLNFPINPGYAEYDLSPRITGTISAVTAFSGMYNFYGGWRQMITDYNVWEPQNFEPEPGVTPIQISSKYHVHGIAGTFYQQTKRLRLTNYATDLNEIVYVTLEYTKNTNEQE